MTGCKQKYVLNIRIKKAFITALCVVFIILSLLLSESFADSIRKTLADTVTQVIPALFPFMVLSRFMTNSGIISVFEKTLGGMISRVFSVKKEASSAVFLGLLSGFPVGAATVCELYNCGKLSKREAERSLGTAHNTGPAFPVSVIGTYLWHSTRFGVAVYMSQVLSLFIISKLFRHTYEDKPYRDAYRIKTLTVSESLTNAVSSSAVGCVNIIGFIVFWKSVADALLFLLPSEAYILGYATVAVLEFSSGSACGAALGGSVGALLTGFAVGFGGVSALMQASHSTAAAGLSLKKCVLFKISQGLLCAVMCGCAFLMIF